MRTSQQPAHTAAVLLVQETEIAVQRGLVEASNHVERNTEGSN